MFSVFSFTVDSPVFNQCEQNVLLEPVITNLREPMGGQIFQTCCECFWL